MLFEIIYRSCDILGTVAFAASGAMLAIDRELDLFGVLFLGGITAVGGGVLRDMLLGITPPSAFADPLYITVALVTALVVFLCAARFKQYWAGRQLIDRLVNLADAIGLGVFSVIGVQTAVRGGYIDNGFLCVFMGMTTGIGGGVFRDLLSRTVPAVLQKHIYAVASIVGASIAWAMLRFEGNRSLAIILGMLATFLIRMLSTHYNWNLPKIKKKEEGNESHED